MNKCIIIGAGLGDLSASIYLAAKGIKVEVFEATSHTGGVIFNNIGEYGILTSCQHRK